MEGNDIEDLGGGSFRTVAAVQRYSLLDQYAMGLVRRFRGAVVLLRGESHEHVGQPHARVGAGGRHHVQRNPPRRPHPGRHRDRRRRARRLQPIRRSVHRQAFVYLVSAGKVADNGQVAKVDGIRRAWEAILPAGDGQADAGDHDAALATPACCEFALSAHVPPAASIIPA